MLKKFDRFEDKDKGITLTLTEDGIDNRDGTRCMDFFSVVIESGCSSSVAHFTLLKDAQAYYSNVKKVISELNIDEIFDVISEMEETVFD